MEDNQLKIYVVLKLAYYDDYLSGVEVVGTYTDKAKATIIANNVAKTNNTQYTFRGKVYETTLI